MSKLFCIMGKSASGKDTIFKRLVQDEVLNLKTVVSYTTRPMREGEQEGVEYHFVSPQTLETLRNEGRVIECRDYHTVLGLWNYFMVDDGQIDFSGFRDYRNVGILSENPGIFWQRTCHSDLCLCGRRASVVPGVGTGKTAGCAGLRRDVPAVPRRHRRFFRRAIETM